MPCDDFHQFWNRQSRSPSFDQLEDYTLKATAITIRETDQQVRSRLTTSILIRYGIEIARLIPRPTSSCHVRAGVDPDQTRPGQPAVFTCLLDRELPLARRDLVPLSACASQPILDPVPRTRMARTRARIIHGCHVGFLGGKRVGLIATPPCGLSILKA